MELTRALLDERIAFAAIRARAAMPPGEPILASFAVLYCDRCGATIEPAHLPAGWTTVGDFEGGWIDLCRGCSS